MKKILVPCDFSETSENALNYAIHAAVFLSAEIELLNITPIPVMSSEFGLAAYDFTAVQQDSENTLNKLADQIRKKHPALKNITTASKFGAAAETIVEHCSSGGFDLVIMGISGHGNKFIKNLVGSTSVSVAKRIETPLLIIPPKYTFKKVQKIAYACDYDEHLKDNTSLIQVKYICALLGASLSILHVIPEGHELNKAEANLDNFVEHELDHTEHQTFIITENHVSDGILEFIENHDVDMLMLEPRKHSFLHNLFYPSVTNNMAFLSPIPVFTFHG